MCAHGLPRLPKTHARSRATAGEAFFVLPCDEADAAPAHEWATSPISSPVIRAAKAAPAAAAAAATPGAEGGPPAFALDEAPPGAAAAAAAAAAAGAEPAAADLPSVRRSESPWRPVSLGAAQSRRAHARSGDPETLAAAAAEAAAAAAADAEPLQYPLSPHSDAGAYYGGRSTGARGAAAGEGHAAAAAAAAAEAAEAAAASGPLSPPLRPLGDPSAEGGSLAPGGAWTPNDDAGAP